MIFLLSLLVINAGILVSSQNCGMLYSLITLWGIVNKLSFSHPAFEVNPKDTSAKRNDKNIELHCQPSSDQDFVIWEVFLDNGTYWTVTGSDTARQLSRFL